jgi:hypothetical protein
MRRFLWILLLPLLAVALGQNVDMPVLYDASLGQGLTYVKLEPSLQSQINQVVTRVQKQQCGSRTLLAEDAQGNFVVKLSGSFTRVKTNQVI